MSSELTQISLQDQFRDLIAQANNQAIHSFLDDQNITDVADLIYDNINYESQIISSLSIHRASSVFKILELATQKKNN